MTTSTGPARQPTLWIISELYYPEQTSTGYFLTKIAEGLAKSYNVQVICGQPAYSERGIKAPSREERHGVTIHRMKSTHFDKDKLAFRVLNAISMTVMVAFFIFRHFKQGDTFVVVTNPPTLLPVAIGVAKIKRCRAVLLVHDVFPDSLAATKMISPLGIPYRILAWLMGKTFRSFDHVIVLGRDMLELMKSRHGVAEDRLVIIPNWGDIEEIMPMDRASNPFAIQYGLVDKTVIQFSGNIGRTHDIGSLIEAARRLQHIEDLVFLFVGYGGKTALIDHAIHQEKLSNIRFTPRQPRDMLGAMLGCSDATVIAFEEEMLGISVPSRMYNIMSAGRPIIAMAHLQSELALCVSENDAGWVVPAGDRSQLQSVIETIARDRNSAEVVRKGQNARRAAMTDYRFDAVIQSYCDVLK